jgi:hypothetical protein
MREARLGIVRCEENWLAEVQAYTTMSEQIEIDTGGPTYR